MSTHLLFPDNTVLVRFARVQRMDLLAALVRGNGRWCGTVAGECDRSAQEPGLETMAQAHAMFGEPLRLQTGQEIVDTTTIRTSLAAPGDPVTRHLGEAETISIITNRRLTAFFVTDDRDAAQRAEEHGIRTYTTWDLLRLAVRIGALTADEAYDYVRELGGHREKLIQVQTRAAWTEWCNS
ncbi:hypothetical protein ACH3VR_21260 [Microbacterium sp. B2969]|uniref:PIN domain-containing protein n=1 Tax=Microbacterium alkaliflavum TaxID=3248839 RepID=A0ABW7QDD7_9MICO